MYNNPYMRVSVCSYVCVELTVKLLLLHVRSYACIHMYLHTTYTYIHTYIPVYVYICNVNFCVFLLKCPLFSYTYLAM